MSVKRVLVFECPSDLIDPSITEIARREHGEYWLRTLVQSMVDDLIDGYSQGRKDFLRQYSSYLDTCELTEELWLQRFESMTLDLAWVDRCLRPHLETVRELGHFNIREVRFDLDHDVLVIRTC